MTVTEIGSRLSRGWRKSPLLPTDRGPQGEPALCLWAKDVEGGVLQAVPFGVPLAGVSALIVSFVHEPTEDARFPTFPELVESAREAAPGYMWSLAFPAFVGMPDVDPSAAGELPNALLLLPAGKVAPVASEASGAGLVT